MTAVLKVGHGRGFAVNRRHHLGHDERVIITAAHCLEHALLVDGTEGLPPCHPWRYSQEETYRSLLGRLGEEPTVWAQCLFADPIADITVLGQPDSQAFTEVDAFDPDAYDEFIDSMEVLTVADAPAQGVETVSRLGGYQFKVPTAGEGRARVLSLDGEWREGRIKRSRDWLTFEPGELLVPGMSGSPILNIAGAAIAVVSVDGGPVIVDRLSATLVRGIVAAAEADRADTLPS